MITQFYRAGGSMVKVVINKTIVTIYDDNLAIRGVTAEQILERDIEKKEEWNNFMAEDPTENEIAMELEEDFKESFGYMLANEVITE